MSASENDALESFQERLKNHYPNLSRQQRNIATFLLDHLQEVAFLSVPTLAERTGASEATVVRLFQAIGYKGFTDLKTALVETLRDEASAESSVPEPAAGNSADAMTLVAEQDQANIRRTVETTDRTELVTIARMLFQADHIFTFGMGVSAHVADLAAYLFTEHGLRSHSLDHSYSTPREQLLTLRDTDLVLVFSFPPYSRQTLEVLQESKERGVSTIAITDRLSAPAAVMADKALCAASEGVMLNNSTAGIAVLLNSLLLELAFNHRGETVEALTHINRMMRSTDSLLGDEESKP